MVLGLMYKEVNSKLDGIRRDFDKKDGNKVADYFAEALLEKGHLNFAYDIYKKIDSKNAKIMQETFPKVMLEFVLIKKDGKRYPITGMK